VVSDEVRLFANELKLAGYRVELLGTCRLMWDEQEQALFHRQFTISEWGKDDVHLALTGKYWNVYITPISEWIDKDRFFETFDEAADYMMELLRDEELKLRRCDLSEYRRQR
jgi:hypothetical protein